VEGGLRKKPYGAGDAGAGLYLLYISPTKLLIITHLDPPIGLRACVDQALRTGGFSKSDPPLIHLDPPELVRSRFPVTGLHCYID
jgi:hypothetical protein